MAIFTLAGATIAGAIGLGATAASFISAGLALGANLAVSYFRRQKQSSVSRTPSVAISGSVQFGADTNAWAVYGKFALFGQRLYYAKWGDGDEYNADVYKLSNGWCDGLEPEIIFFGEKHTLVAAATIGDEDEHWKVQGFDDLISIRFYAGRPDQLADARLVSVTAGQANPWKATSKCTGNAYVVFEAKYDQDKFEQGYPEPKFIMRGLRLYDWRKDSTVVGGLGTHRVDDPSTWEFSSNNALARAHNEIGLRGLASDRSIIGMGKSFSELHLASYTTAANVCDTDRTKNGRTFNTYSIGMAVDSETDFTEVLRDFDDSMAGYALNASGLSGVIVGAPQVPAGEILAVDIRVDGSKTHRPRRDINDTANHLTGSFMAPDALWNLDSLTPVTVAADVAADKQGISLAYDFPQVNDPEVAQYLLNIRYRQIRKGGYRKLPVSNRLAYQVEGGDWWTYAGKTWLVMGRTYSQGWFLELAETGDDIYSETGIAIGPIVTTPTPPTIAPSSQVANLIVQADADTNAEGAGVPILVVSWDPPTDPRVEAVLLRFRRVGDTETFMQRHDDPSDGTAVIRSNVVGSADYEVQASFVHNPARSSVWTSWEAVTTANPPTVLGDSSVTQSALNADIQGLFAAWNRLRAETIEQFDAINDALATSMTIEILERSREEADVRAFIATQTKALADETAAVALQATTVSTTLDGNNANISLVQASENGEEVRFGILGEINGATGGFQFQGIQLDNNETAYTFEIDGDLIVDGSITSGKIATELIITTRITNPSGSVVLDMNDTNPELVIG